MTHQQATALSFFGIAKYYNPRNYTEYFYHAANGNISYNCKGQMRRYEGDKQQLLALAEWNPVIEWNELP